MTKIHIHARPARPSFEVEVCKLLLRHGANPSLCAPDGSDATARASTPWIASLIRSLQLAAQLEAQAEAQAEARAKAQAKEIA